MQIQKIQPSIQAAQAADDKKNKESKNKFKVFIYICIL